MSPRWTARPCGTPRIGSSCSFAEPSLESAQRAALITREGARYHVPGGSPAVTNPLLVLALMQPRYQPRLRFTLGSEDRSLGPGVRAVRFEEFEVREAQRSGRDREQLPPLLGDAGRVRGTVSVEVASGRILKTEARLLGGAVWGTSTSATTFAHDEHLGLTVPKEMRTTWTYEARPVNGIARYGEFRRFNVQTESQLQPPPQP